MPLHRHLLREIQTSRKKSAPCCTFELFTIELDLSHVSGDVSSIRSHLSDVEKDVKSIKSDVERIDSGRCSNRKLCDY